VRRDEQGMWRRLPSQVYRLHPYCDKALGLKELMATSMKKMAPVDFERVLHPIFQV
jgi:hypothetical protein